MTIEPILVCFCNWSFHPQTLFPPSFLTMIKKKTIPCFAISLSLSLSLHHTLNLWMCNEGFVWTVFVRSTICVETLFQNQLDYFHFLFCLISLCLASLIDRLVGRSVGRSVDGRLVHSSLLTVTALLPSSSS